ncbi:hypothetical protein [Noviherbaspirillum massiliense]|uniref:hypothetical protein n=1 Tax=Noviherbaspirillum massiliense TaxID=1465823 RepID=UPI0002F380FE|nr:hypothetical protein [Noviherbaspirillum massiliense]
MMPLRFRASRLAPALIAISMLSSCGGGGGGGGSSSGDGSFTSPSGETKDLPQMTMSCIDATQCSGGSVIRVDNGVALTSSGVQVYGISTSDLANPIIDKTNAHGLALASGGITEVRVDKDGNGGVTRLALILRQLGISWDDKTERPPIVETFQNTQGRIRLGSNGTIVPEPLPPSSDLVFYDWASKRAAGTQLHYANNRYFPRDGNPPRCAAGAPCPNYETTGLQSSAGNWRSGGTTPDIVSAYRLHEDGDIHAGDGPPDANGNPTILPGGDGYGVPHPGSKGERSFDGWSFEYANLAAWYTLDTVSIYEWNGRDEHNQNRRGIVAYGDVTGAGQVPDSGAASYSGVVYGWYARSAGDDPVRFHGTALISADFASGEALVTIQNTIADDGSAVTVPAALTATIKTGAASNYLTGAAGNASMSGGLSSRYFGPVVSTGTSGSGPAEIGGAFSLSNAEGATGIGGFIARKK